MKYENHRDLFLKRKFDIFQKFFGTRTEWLDKEIAKILNESKKYLVAYPRS